MMRTITITSKLCSGVRTHGFKRYYHSAIVIRSTQLWLRFGHTAGHVNIDRRVIYEPSLSGVSVLHYKASFAGYSGNYLHA